MSERITSRQRERLLDLVMDEGYVVEEAREILKQEELLELEAALPARERVGRESEAKVWARLKTKKIVAELTQTEPGSVEDVEFGWDGIVRARFKLGSVFDEFYVQVKSSPAGVAAFRREIEKRVWSHSPAFWRSIRANRSEAELEKMLAKAVDEEILKKRFVIIDASSENQIDLDFDEGVKSLYVYWTKKMVALRERLRQRKLMRKAVV